MNNRSPLISLRISHIGIIVVVLLFAWFILHNTETNLMNIQKSLFSDTEGISTLALLIFFTFVFSLFFFYEFKANSYLRVNSNKKLEIYKRQLENLERNIPIQVLDSFLYQTVKNSCYKLWSLGEFDKFIKHVALQKDVLRYIAQLSSAGKTVCWEEERVYINKILELVRLGFDTKDFRIKLFQPNANYRFPSGLFIVPLFNAIEFAMRYRDSVLKMECSSQDGLWNCQISNYTSSIGNSRRYKYCGFFFVKYHIFKENWAIKFERENVNQGMFVVISGNDIN